MRFGFAVVVVAGLIPALAPAAAEAGSPSFNCALAHAPVEKLICADDALADLDAALGRAYQARRTVLAEAERAALQAEQRDWLKGRLAQCRLPASGVVDLAASGPAIACLTQLYKARVDRLAAAPAPALPDSLGFASAKLPATGRQETILTVPKFGRYTIRVASDQGSALQLIDRLAGPGEVAGEAGEKNGRLDLFLERGSYKVVVLSSEKGSGDAALAVTSFTERNETPVGLAEAERSDEDLRDGQQRSYWLRVEKRRTVVIEAAGRDLADLRLWRDGAWLVEAEPSRSELAPRPGRPLTGLQLSADLAPGLYRLTAYGGAPLPWSGDAEAHPFHIRNGIPTLPEAARRRMVASPFGVDRFLVPGGADHLRLELPTQGDTAVVTVTPYDPAQPFPDYVDGRSSALRKAVMKSTVPPVIDAALSAIDQPHLVSVTREAGAAYVLQAMSTSTTLPSSAAGPSLISTLVAGQAEDTVDATALLAESGKVVAAQAVVLDGRSAWRRRFNLLGPLSVVVQVTGAGDYVVEAQGADGEFKLDPVFPPKDYRPSRFEAPGKVWRLEAGYWLLRAQPRQDGKGVVTLAVRPAALPDAPAANQPRMGAVQLPMVSLDQKNKRYRLVLGEQGVPISLVTTPVPAVLGALPLSLPAGTSREVAVTLEAGQALSARREDGSPVALVVDGAAAEPEPHPAAGRHTVRLDNTGETVLTTVLEARPIAPPQATPPLPAEALSAITAFPPLKPGAPQAADLGRQERATFTLSVDEPALYRIQSTGLLETAGTLRTVVRTGFAEAAANGAGRNFLMQQFLREGQYQLTVRTQGKTRGHLGVTVDKAPVREAGYLVEGIPARTTLAAGEGVVYRLEIAERGRYRLNAISLSQPEAQPAARSASDDTSSDETTDPEATSDNSEAVPAEDAAPEPLHAVTMRFEDEDAWPLMPPGGPASFERDLEPGVYRLVLLPPALPGRVVTLLERVRDEPVIQGHGPHPLRFGVEAGNQWMESPAGGPRTPDTWRFDLPAPADVTVHFSEGMEADLVRDGDPAPHALVSWKRDWRGRLPAGAWRLEARTVRPNNRFDYTLKLDVAQLLPGQRREVAAPGSVELSLGADCLMEAASFGSRDVAGKLYDQAGRLLDRADDRTDDWNFAISRRLPAGFYRLKVEPVGAATARTTVSLACWDEVAEPPLALGKPVTLSDGKLHGWPVSLARDSLLVVGARSRDEVGLALDVRENKGGNEGDGWVTVASTTGRTPWLALPGDGRELRLRAWSISRGGAPILLTSQALSPAAVAERDLAKGVALAVVPGLEPALSVARLALDQPGLLQLANPPAGLAWSDRAGRAVTPAGDLLPSGDGRLWLVAEGAARLSARRIGFAADALRFTLPADGRPVFPVEDAAPSLWLAQALTGQPGIATAPRGQPADIRRMGVGAGSAVAVALGSRQPLGLGLWNAADDQPLAVSVRRLDLGAGTADRLAWGVADLTLAAAGNAFDLPSGPKQMTLTLPADTAAVLVRGSEILGTLWSDRRATTLLLDSEAERLLLKRTVPEPASASVALVPLETPGLRVGDGAVFRRAFATAGTVRLELRLSEAERAAAARGTLRLRLAGPGLEATLVERSGRVSTEPQKDGALPVREDGVLELVHEPGLVAAWLDSGDDAAWPHAVAEAAPVSLPMVKALSGTEMLLPLAAPAPTLVHVATATPALVGVRGPTAAAAAALYPSGASLHLVVGPTPTVVALRAAGEGGLSGTLQAAATPPRDIGEGLGPRLALAPGDARLFRFTLKEAGPIGVGVRGSADSARCRVLDAAGRELASGVVAMVTLQPGTYYLAVENPPGAPAIEVQPALVGQTRPDKGPPPDIRQSFVDLLSQPQ